MRVIMFRRVIAIGLISMLLLVSAALPMLVGAALNGASFTDVANFPLTTEASPALYLVDGGGSGGPGTCGSGC